MSPIESISTELRVGTATINTLSPAESVSPITVELSGGDKVDVPANSLSVGEAFTGSTSDTNQLDGAIDLLLVSRVLTPEELLNTDARRLMAIKRCLYEEILSSPEITRILRERVRQLPD